MSARRVLAAAFAALALLPPAAAAGELRTDPLRSLGGDSPLCAHPRSAADRARCERSGALEHPYPLDRYRFDWHIDTGITKVDNNIHAFFQFAIALLWQGVLWSAKAILLAFQWAFSLDLLGDALGPMRMALDRLHGSLFGAPWLLAGFSLLGLWGLWNGIVRRRTVETAVGLAASVLMVAAALALIARPAETLGVVSRGINDLKAGVLAGATEGTVAEPDRALERSSERIFNTIVLRPWCAVQFGDVDWCLERAPGDRVTRAERWLAHSVASKQRDAEYEVLAREGYETLDAELVRQVAGYRERISDDDRAKIQMQEKDRTFFRIGLIGLVLIGVAGWVILLGWLSVQSLLQGLIALVLLLGAPVMLLAPCFGERGRQTFAAWGTRLLAAVVSGLIYALLLAVVIVIAGVIGELDVAVSWLAGWLLQAIFLWGVFFRRHQFLDWLSGGTHRPGSELSPRKAHQHAQAVQAAGAAAVTLAGAPVKPLALAGAAGTRWQREDGARRETADRAAGAVATEQLRERAREQLQTKYDAAHPRLAAHQDAQRKLPEMRRRRDAIERELKAHRLEPPRRDELGAERGKLIAQGKALEKRLLPRDEEGVLRRFIETADRNLVESGERFSDGQVDAQLDGLRTDLAYTSDPLDPTHAWRRERYQPGIAESDLAKLPLAQRAALARSIEADLERDRALFAAVPHDPALRPARAERRAVVRELNRTDPAAHLDYQVRRDELRATHPQLGERALAPLHNVAARRRRRKLAEATRPSL